jgi:hypothetical protein
MTKLSFWFQSFALPQRLPTIKYFETCLLAIPYLLLPTGIFLGLDYYIFTGSKENIKSKGSYCP